jgi:hypothetical protein
LLFVPPIVHLFLARSPVTPVACSFLPALLVSPWATLGPAPGSQAASHCYSD